jgi:toxin ParE1/3/4
MSSKLIISQAAKTDLTEIWVYVAQDDVEAADRLVDAVLATAEKIAEWPEMGRQRPELLAGLWSFPVGRLLIFYRIRESAVEVVRVVHGRRDLDSLF